VEAVNAGVWGYSSRQGLINLDQRLLKYQPDLVIVEFGITDPMIALFRHFPDQRIMKGDIDSGFEKIYRSPQAAAFLVIYEQPLFVALKNFVHVLKVAALMRKLGEMDQQKLTQPALKKPDADFEGYKNSRVPLRDFKDNHLQMIFLANRKGFKLIFYIPFGIPSAYRNLLLKIAAENNIPVVDFSERLKGFKLEELAANPEYARLLQFYREKLGDDFLKKQPQFLVSTDNGVHPNAVGNRIIAEDRLLIPSAGAGKESGRRVPLCGPAWPESRVVRRHKSSRPIPDAPRQSPRIADSRKCRLN
jgi:lysophospholipase L1-like esterase